MPWHLVEAICWWKQRDAKHFLLVSLVSNQWNLVDSISWWQHMNAKNWQKAVKIL